STVCVDGLPHLVGTVPTSTTTSRFGVVRADAVVVQHRDNGVAVVALVGDELSEVLGYVRFGVFVSCFGYLFQIIYCIGDRSDMVSVSPAAPPLIVVPTTAPVSRSTAISCLW